MNLMTVAAPKLRIGPIALDVPVVLAPMAGITNTAFRRLCREFGAGLYVSEMITSRALVERTELSMRLIQHHESETPRSIQLYGVDPKTVAEAVTMLVAEDRADHIDLNFGCPVPKVTRKGGGAALPWKSGLFRDIVERAVKAAGDIPLTVKMRKGIDAGHLTYLEAGRAAEGAGVASIALHARTAADFYSGQADWSAIAKLKEAIASVPVLGNGDIWSASDAIRMVEETGCDGVVVGRGCLGRPWLFGDLAAAFGGEIPEAWPEEAVSRSSRGVLEGSRDDPWGESRSSFELSAPEFSVPEALEGALEGTKRSPGFPSRASGTVFASGQASGGVSASEAGVSLHRAQPSLGIVAATLRRHTELLTEFFESEERACRDIRKHITWYFKGYPVGGDVRAALGMVESLQQMDDLLGSLDWSQPYPGEPAEGPRGRAGTPKRPSLPDRWLESHELGEVHRSELADAELSHSGG